MTITRGLSFPDYRALPGVNWSTLKAAADSPLHYQHALTAPRVETDAMRFGSAVHCAVLEPDRFPLAYIVWDGARRAGKEWDAFRDVNADRIILKADEYATCLAVRDAVHANKDAARLLAGAETEAVVTWTDKATGLECKARIDALAGPQIADLKTTGTIDARLFMSLSARMLYHSQMAFYSRGVNEHQPPTPNPCLIAVEAKPPHDVGVFRLTDDAMLAGDQQVSDLLAHVASCRERNEWPGRYADEIELSLPAWMAVDPDEGGWGDLPERSAT